MAEKKTKKQDTQNAEFHPIPEVPLIYQLIPKVMQDIDPIAKNGENKGQNYKYRKIDDIYNELCSIVSKWGIFTIPWAVEDERFETVNTTKGGKLYIYSAMYTFRFQACDGSFIDAKARGKGTDTLDKETNKASTTAHKYVLTQTFLIPTEEKKDTESDNYEHLLPQDQPSSVRRSTPQVIGTVKDHNGVVWTHQQTTDTKGQNEYVLVPSKVGMQPIRGKNAIVHFLEEVKIARQDKEADLKADKQAREIKGAVAAFEKATEAKVVTTKDHGKEAENL